MPQRRRPSQRRGIARFFTDTELGVLDSLRRGPTHLYEIATTRGFPRSSVHKALLRLKDGDLVSPLDAKPSAERPGLYITPWCLTDDGQDLVKLLVKLDALPEEPS